MDFWEFLFGLVLGMSEEEKKILFGREKEDNDEEESDKDK